MATNKKLTLPSFEKFIFLLGIVLLLIATALVFSFPDITRSQFLTLVTLLSLSSAMIISQIPGAINIELPIGVKAAGAIAFGIFVFYLLYDKYDTLATRHDPEDVDCIYPPVDVAILCSGNNDYNRTILVSFLNNLDQKLPIKHKRCLRYVVRYGPGLPIDGDGVEQQYDDAIFRLTEIKHFDYFVAIGTAAAISFNKFINKNQKYKDGNLIFLGVTDPIESELVVSLEQRNESSNVGGVAYCGNYEMLPAKIHQLFPDRKLIYIYSADYRQDEQIAKRIAESKLAKENILIIKKLNRPPKDGDFNDQSAVYFSWETIEEMFASERFEILEKITYLVSTTSIHAEQGIVPFAVSTSDIEIGRKGVEIISRSLDGESLGKIDVYIPKWITLANCEKAQSKGILRKDYINIVKEKFECD